MQEEVCAEVPLWGLFLVLRRVGTICTLHLGTRLLQEQLNRDLGEIEGIATIYKLQKKLDQQ